MACACACADEDPTADNRPPTFGDPVRVTVPEGQVRVAAPPVADDPDGDALTYALGGPDAERFRLDDALELVDAPDFEAPADTDADGVYRLELRADDGRGGTATLEIEVAVTDVNEAPTLTSGAEVTVVENVTETGYAAAADDPEGDALEFSLEGEDAAQLRIDPASGALSFVTAPDFEAPADADGDNAYAVTVVVTDPGDLSDRLELTVTVTDDAGNEAPVFTSPASVGVPENQADTGYVAAATDTEGDAFTFSIDGGPDAAALSIDPSTGALTFSSAPDFEAPGDADGDNVYAVTLAVADSEGRSTLDLEITVDNVNEFDPAFTSGPSGTAAENGRTTDYVATATDGDLQPVTFSITGGADAAAFALDGATGVLGLAAPLDFEAPSDANQDNGYEVEITADDGDGRSTAITVTIDVVDDVEPPVFTSTTTAQSPENALATGYVAAATAPGETVVYAIAGGADAARFDIDPASGALSFVTAPDFEAPTDADQDNDYEVVISANATATANLAVTVTVTDVDEAPVFGGAFTGTADENQQTTTAQASATDPEGQTVTYAIAGGADAARLSVDASTGVLSLVAAPDFEAPADADGDNDYAVTIEATAGGRTTAQAFVVSVVDVNEAPAFTSAATANLPENQTATGYTAAAADPEGQALAYAVAGGPDQAFFTVDPSTGQVSLVSGLDFEAPQDANSDNVYEVTFSATDGTFPVTLDVAFTVVDVGELPVFSSPATGSAPENGTATGYTAVAATPGGGAVTYAVAGGADAARFSIDPSTGALTFAQPLDFEATSDANGDNVYEVVISATATAGGLSASLSVRITLTNVDEPPVFVSAGAGAAAENAAATSYVALATDPEGLPISYTIAGGADAAAFSIGGASGALTFAAAPNFEAPTDANGDNVYVLDVGATAGGTTVQQTVQITVSNVNEPPTFSSGVAGTADEGQTSTTYVAAAADPDGTPVLYSLTGSRDDSRFSVGATTGVLSFTTPPNFEAPVDDDANNQYVVQITASAGGDSVARTVTISVNDLNEPPTFGSGATGTAAENQTTTSYTAAATDPEGQAITFSVDGGADAAAFTIGGASGALSFVSAPNFEAPTDAGADNVYDVIIGATAGGTTVTRAVQITVTDVNELPTFTSGTTATLDEGQTATGYTAAANDPDANPITFSLTGARDDGLFTVGATSGVLSFASAPDFEAPADDDANNQYVVQITASAGGDTVAQTVTVTVNDVNEPPTFTSGAAGTAAENQTATSYTAAATDPEGQAITFSITGGADAAAFTIDPSSGVLSLLAPQDFEAPGDADGDGDYSVQVSATAGGETVDRTVTLTLTDVDEAPAFSSPTAISVAENETATGYTAAATDPEGGTVTFSITGGADAARFSLTAGALSFVAAPDFEAPADADTNNAYVVVVTATDGANPVTQTVTVTVTDVPRQLFVDFPPEGANLGGVTTTNITGSITDAPVTQVSSVLVEGQPATLIPGNPTRFTAARAATRADAISLSVQSNYVGGGSDTVTRTVANQHPMPFAQYVAYDPGTGDAIVMDTGNSELVRVDLTTGVRTVLSGAAQTGTDFRGPRGVVVDAANGRALVVDDGRDTVFGVDLTTGARTVLATDADPGPNFATPSGVDYDAAGNRLFVVDDGQNALLAVDLTTGAKTEITGQNVGSGPSLSTPNDVAYDPATQTAYVTDDFDDAVIAVNVTNGARTVLSNDTTGTGPTFTRPEGVVLDAGRLLVVDVVTDQVIAVDLTTGNRTLVVDDNVGTGPNLDEAFDLVLGAAGQLIVADSRVGVLDVAVASGNRTVVTAPISVGSGVSVDGSEDVVYDPSSRRLLLLDGSRINALDLSNLARSTFSSSLQGTGPTFSDVRRGVIDGADLLVTDDNRDAVFRVDLATGDRATLSDDTTGTGPVFGNPQGITIDRSRNRLLVSDTSLDALVAVDLATGNRTAIVGSGLSLSGPVDVLFDAALDRALIVEDGFPNTGLVLFDATTEVRSFLSGSGVGTTTGSGPNFLGPTTIARDASGAFLVSDNTQQALFSVHPTSGDRTVITGSGPSFVAVDAVAVDAPRNRAFVFDGNLGRDTVKMVELGSGQRVIISN